MKKILLILALGLSWVADAQLTVKAESTDTTIWRASKLTSVPSLVEFRGEQKSYAFYYANAKYTTITDIKYLSFNDSSTCVAFFGLLKDLWLKEEGTQITIDLNGTTWLLTKNKKWLTVFSQFSYFYIGANQIDEILTKIN